MGGLGCSNYLKSSGLNLMKNTMMEHLTLDPWQKEVMKTKGNLCLRSGRQVGKSTVIAIKAATYALENPKKLIMIISKVERQAQLLFAKILFNLHNIARTQIKKGKERPTKHKIELKNGSVIHCLPAGDTGYGIMGFTIDLLIADEAAFIPEEVWNSVIPALAVTRGAIWLLSTPFVKEGYYYNCFEDPTFTKFHQSSEDCPRRDDDFLAHKKKTLTRAQYAQMYLGMFVDELMQFYSNEWIKKVCSLIQAPKAEDYFLGVDIARMGEDESTFETLGLRKGILSQVAHEITTHKRLTATAQKIIDLDSKYKYNQIGIDDGGIGAGVLDILLEEDNVRRKVVGLNNAKKSLEPSYVEKPQRKKLLGEDMHVHLKVLGEQGKLLLLNDNDIKVSLRSVQFEYNDTGRMIISGEDTHIAEGIKRAAWCAKSKSLNPWVC